MQRFILLLSLVVISVACNKKTNCTKTLICAHKSIVPVLGGFDSTQMDSVIVYTYAPDSTFSTILSQQTYTNPILQTNITDTTAAYGFDSLAFTVGHDYQVYLPQAGKRYRFYHIIDSGSSVKAPCDNAATSCFTVVYNCTVTGNNYICGSGTAAVYVMLKP